MTWTETPAVKSIMLPPYGRARIVLQALNGVPRKTITGLLRSIYLNSGTPQMTENWLRPDLWISDLLAGNEQVLARKLWQETGQTLNPRYLKGTHLFLNMHGLLRVQPDGTYRMSKAGTEFVEGSVSVVAKIDNLEGVLALLEIVGDRVPRSRLKERWSSFVAQYSNYKKPSSVQATLADRLKNLEERSLVQRARTEIIGTVAGARYLDEVRKLDGP